MTAVAGSNLVYEIGGARLIDDVSIEIESGEFVAIVGPNGAGKTSLMRLLAGELVPTQGRVLLGPRPVTDLHAAELALLRSYLQQSVRPDVPFTVRRVVELGRHPHRHDPENSSDRDAQMVEWAMGFTDVAGLADRRFRSLSGGEQMRVSIARIVAQDATTVFLDEPTAPLDLSFQERVMGRLGGHARAGRAVVVVVHDLNGAAAHADRVVLMSRGRVVADGEPHHVLRDEVLSDAYGHPLRVVDHPFRDSPLVVTEGESG